MDLVDTGVDPWIVEHDACEKVAREIMENLSRRDNEKKPSQAYDVLSAKIRIRLKQFAVEVGELNKKLNLASLVSTLTPEERERRQRQVEILLSKEVQLTQYFNQQNVENTFDAAYNQSRSELFRKSLKDSEIGGTSVTNSEDKNTDFRTINEMRQEQEKLLKEQDEGLEKLLQIVTAQTKIATTINDEVEHHNEILVDIASGMERVDGRINRASDMVRIIEKKEKIWGYWLVAFLLFIVILCAAFA